MKKELREVRDENAELQYQVGLNEGKAEVLAREKEVLARKMARENEVLALENEVFVVKFITNRDRRNFEFRKIIIYFYFRTYSLFILDYYYIP